MTTKPNILREIFSGANGKLSAKRVLGGISLFVALGCIIYLVVVDGSNEVVENLLMTVLIMAASLLGLPAITGAWGKSKVSFGEIDSSDDKNSSTPTPKEDTPPMPSKKPQYKHPECEKCIYRIKGTE